MMSANAATRRRFENHMAYTVTGLHGSKVGYRFRMNLSKIPAQASPGRFHIVVETPRGSNLKLKYEPTWEAMSVSRPLPLGVTYPFDWGFVPSTRGPDGDPVDALVVWDVSSYPGVVLICRPLGLMCVEQNRTNHDPSVRIRNDRILAVPEAARRQSDTITIDDLPARVRDECAAFTLASTALEGKDVRVVGWEGPEAVLALLKSVASG